MIDQLAKRRDQRQAAAARGFCGHCLFRLARPGKWCCEVCAASRRRSMLAKTKARRAAGTCIVCDSPRAPGYVRCARHVAIANASRQSIHPGRAAKIRAGVCISSGCEGTAIDYRKCAECRAISAQKKRAFYEGRIAKGLCRCGTRPVKVPGSWCAKCRQKRRRARGGST